MSGIVFLILRILLALTLYAFLSWAVLMIWRDLRVQGRMISAPLIPLITFSPVGGGSDPPRTMDTAEIYIGRSPNSDYPLSDETVSARHARLSYHHNQWWVEDLKSTNGTFLNDERVTIPTVIVSGDELRCGQVRLNINIDEKGH